MVLNCSLLPLLPLAAAMTNPRLVGNTQFRAREFRAALKSYTEEVSCRILVQILQSLVYDSPNTSYCLLLLAASHSKKSQRLVVKRMGANAAGCNELVALFGLKRKPQRFARMREWIHWFETKQEDIQRHDMGHISVKHLESWLLHSKACRAHGQVKLSIGFLQFCLEYFILQGISVVLANRAACWLCLGTCALDWYRGWLDATCAVILDPKNIKGHYRKTKSLLNLGMFDAAIHASTVGLSVDCPAQDKKMLGDLRKHIYEIKCPLLLKHIRSIESDEFLQMAKIFTKKRCERCTKRHASQEFQGNIENDAENSGICGQFYWPHSRKLANSFMKVIVQSITKMVDLTAPVDYVSTLRKLCLPSFIKPDILRKMHALEEPSLEGILLSETAYDVFLLLKLGKY